MDMTGHDIVSRIFCATFGKIRRLKNGSIAEYIPRSNRLLKMNTSKFNLI
jgi:hypothetical protein